jgi:YVTN family beta-propeller protein
MHLRPSARLRRAVAATVLAALASLVAPAVALAQNAYITNSASGTVSVINTATNGIVGSPINVGDFPLGLAVTPDGSKVYVANFDGNTVSVIATATDTVLTTLPVGNGPSAFGLFIQPAKPLFAGTVGRKNCAGQSVAAVTRQHRGMPRAASALGYASVADLQGAIRTYCNG